MSVEPSPHHYSFAHRVIAWVSGNFFGNLTYRSRGGLTRGLRRKGGLGFLPEWLASERIVTPEVRFWRHQAPSMGKLTVYDIGAFEGLMTIFFASTGASVTSFEPNPRSAERLKANVALNNLSKRVRLVESGVGAAEEQRILVVDELMGGGSSADLAIAAQTTDTAAMHGENIQIAPLDVLVQKHALPSPDLIKIDIEGMELDALRGATGVLATSRPTLYLEMHGTDEADKSRRVKAIVDFLIGAGYAQIWHVETGAMLTNANADIARHGHLVAVGRGWQPKLSAS